MLGEIFWMGFLLWITRVVYLWLTQSKQRKLWNEWNALLSHEQAKHTKQVQELTDMTQSLIQGRELEIRVAQDAINREARTKAAFVAVLREHLGLNEEEIQRIVETIDKEPKI